MERRFTKMLKNIYWLTGQPGSGKTAIAKAIIERNKSWVNIDGDELRKLVVNNDYSEDGRYLNIKLAQTIAEFLYLNDKTVVVSLVSPYRELREDFKKKLNGSLTEIYVHTTEDRGKNEFQVTNYEEPLENFIDLDTTGKTVEESIEELRKIIII